MNFFNELSQVIEQFGKDKGVDRDQVIEAVETALLTAAKKKLGPHVEIESHFNSDTGEIELFQFKTVVEDQDVADEEIEIELTAAKTQDPDVELGDSIGIKLDSALFGRIAAQTAKQVINQRMRDAEREIVYSEFLSRKGEIISGIVRRFERGAIVVDLGKSEAYIPQKEQIPGEHFKVGDRVQAYLLDVIQTPRGPQVVLSRATPLYLSKLFEMEVPEIYEGIVTIRSAARDPGSRAKIAVSSKDSDVDPVGACVGMKGSRVQNIVQELKGERVDIIKFSDDVAKFVCEALKPAEVSKVLMDEDNRYMEVVVADSQLSLAIGRKGQNVRLAAQLTGWKIDVVSETKMTQRYESAKTSLMQIPGISDTVATALFQNGIHTIFDVVDTDVEELTQVPGLQDPVVAERIKGEAKKVVDSGQVIMPVEEVKFEVSSVIKKKKTADELLRDEMQQLLKKEKQAEKDSDLLKIKGVGTALAQVISEAGFSNEEQIASASEDDFTLKVASDDKATLKSIYKSATIMNNEKMVESGRIPSISEQEVENFKKLGTIGKSVLNRLAAVGITTVSDLKAVTLDDFIAKTDLDVQKATEIYNSVKAQG
jgi:N utilization substance protein A